MKSSTRSRLALLFLLVLLITLLMVPLADATVRNSWNKTKAGVSKFWAKASFYLKHGAFWINILLIFAGIFLLFTFFFKDKVSDKNQQIMLYIIIGLFAIILATKIVNDAGQPTYIWSQEKFRHSTQFLIGPTSPYSLGKCPQESRLGALWSGIKTSLGGESQVECCGTGSYFRKVGDKTVCKQAILRVNENGSGLMALIFASLAMFLLLNYLLKDSLNDAWGKKIKIGLALLIGALMANDRLTTNQILVTAGWALFIIFAKKFSKAWGGEDRKKNTAGMVFGVAVPYALIQLILGMFGTSLFGTTINSADVTFGTIIIDLLVGCMFGFIYASMQGGTLGKMFKKMNDNRQEIAKKLADENKLGQMLLQATPGVGRIYDWWYKRKNKGKIKPLSENQKKINHLTERLNQLEDQNDHNYAILTSIDESAEPLKARQMAMLIQKNNHEILAIKSAIDRLKGE